MRDAVSTREIVVPGRVELLEDTKRLKGRRHADTCRVGSP